MQALIAKQIKPAEEGQVSYEIQWVIPNWKEVRKDVILVRNQQAVFETGEQPTQMFPTKWKVGLKDDFYGNSRRVRVHWQLLDIKGSEPQFKLDAKLSTTLCRADEDNGIAGPLVDELTHEIGLGEVIIEKKLFLDIGRDSSVWDNPYINSNGSIEYRLVLTMKTLDNESAQSDFKRLKLEQFSKRSHAQLRENLWTLLKEDKNGDLKIITSDGVELRASQSILKVQSPVFAGMLNSDLSESKTGIVKMEDICGKTMRILLHYFNTGDLLTGWNDDDTIVEFAYAAGKYQVTQILELLDAWFGLGAQDEVSHLDVQLLNLAGKLSLKNAEKRLLQRIIDKVTAAKSGEDLFQLFGYNDEEVSKKAETLAAEPIGSSKVFDVLDYVVGNTSNQVDLSGHGFNLLALVHRNGSWKGLEKVLLKQIAETVSKFTTAEEIIVFVGGSEQGK